MSADIGLLVVGGGPAGVTAALGRVAELQFVFPTLTEAIGMAAQKICRTIGVGRFPQVWSYLGTEE